VNVTRIFLALCAMLIASPSFAGEMKPFVAGSWEELLKGHEGKPVVVHFWGLTCPPCIVEMPRWGALRRDNPEIAIVMVASDPAPADTEGQVAVLKRSNLLDAENWTFADAFSERLRHEIDPRWRGELPRTLLIAGNGARLAVVGPIDPKAVRTWFDGLKGENP